MNQTTATEHPAAGRNALDEPVQQDSPAPAPPKKKRRGKESGLKTFLRILITLAVIALGIFLILFVVAKAGRFDSIGSMLRHMGVELSLMWQRIIS